MMMSVRIEKIQCWLVSFETILGLVFGVASISKLPVQSQFINDVAGYSLLPHNLSPFYGATLPQIELPAG